MIPLTASAFRFCLPANRPAKGALLALVLLATLSGCGGTEQEPLACHGYGCGYDIEGPAGMRLRYAPAVEASDPRANDVFLEQLYQMVAECVRFELTRGLRLCRFSRPVP